MNRLSKFLRLTGLLALMVPAFAAAQAPAGAINTQYLLSYKNSIIGIINTILIPILMAIALLMFMWGVYNYFIAGGDNEDKRKEGRQFVLWSVVGFAIIISVWGLVAIVIFTLGINGSNALPPPSIGGSGYTSGGTITPSPSGGTVTPQRFPAGSAAANCFNTCPGTCQVDSAGNARCITSQGFAE